MKEKEHMTAVVPKGNGSQATCSCGWSGPKRVYHRDARRNANEHRTSPGSEVVE